MWIWNITRLDQINLCGMECEHAHTNVTENLCTWIRLVSWPITLAANMVSLRTSGTWASSERRRHINSTEFFSILPLFFLQSLFFSKSTQLCAHKKGEKTKFEMNGLWRLNNSRNSNWKSAVRDGLDWCANRTPETKVKIMHGWVFINEKLDSIWELMCEYRLFWDRLKHATDQAKKNLSIYEWKKSHFAPLNENETTNQTMDSYTFSNT